MPHTSHSRRNQPNPTDRHLTTHFTPDGWTHVGRRHHALPNPIAPNSTTALRALLERLTPAQTRLYISLSPTLHSFRQPKEARDVTVQQVRERYERTRSAWREGTARAELQRILAGPRLESVRGKVLKGVCLGLGSLSGEVGAAHALWQLCCFVDVFETLTKDTHGKGWSTPGIPRNTILFAQDPIFNTVDVALLAELGVTVLADPEAFNEIDGKTFVFAPHYPIAAWSAEMRSDMAPLLIGNCVGDGLDHVPEAEEIQQIFSRFERQEGERLKIPDLGAKEELRAFVREHVEVLFPTLEEDEHAFTGTRMYWTDDDAV